MNEYWGRRDLARELFFFSAFYGGQMRRGPLSPDPAHHQVVVCLCFYTQQMARYGDVWPMVKECGRGTEGGGGQKLTRSLVKIEGQQSFSVPGIAATVRP